MLNEFKRHKRICRCGNEFIAMSDKHIACSDRCRREAECFFCEKKIGGKITMHHNKTFHKCCLKAYLENEVNQIKPPIKTYKLSKRFKFEVENSWFGDMFIGNDEATTKAKRLGYG